MSKKIKSMDTNIVINESTINVVEIGNISFEMDERYPWIDIYGIGNEEKTFIEQVDTDETTEIVSDDDLRRFALNWYFNNVEIVSDEVACTKTEE